MRTPNSYRAHPVRIAVVAVLLAFLAPSARAQQSTHVGMRLGVDVDSKDEARRILPPAFRTIAKIVQLNYFTVDEIEDILREHEAKGGAA